MIQNLYANILRYAIEFHSLMCYSMYKLSFEAMPRGRDMVSRALLKYNTQQKHPAAAHCGVFLYAAMMRFPHAGACSRVP